MVIVILTETAGSYYEDNEKTIALHFMKPEFSVILLWKMQTGRNICYDSLDWFQKAQSME